MLSALAELTQPLMKALSNQQRLHLVNTEQLFENYRAALKRSQHYAYGMRWKTIRGVDYLFRERDRRGNGKLLGRRSEQTEAQLSASLTAKAAAAERPAPIEQQLDESPFRPLP